MSERLHQARQGDIFTEECQITSDMEEAIIFAKGRRVTVLEGEATGHKHEFVARKSDEVVEQFDQNGRRYVRIPAGGADLVHPEHATIPYDKPGVYEIVRQSAFSLNSLGREMVAD